MLKKDTQNERAGARESQGEQAGGDLQGWVMMATKTHVKNKVLLSSNASLLRPASENPLRHRVRWDHFSTDARIDEGKHAKSMLKGKC